MNTGNNLALGVPPMSFVEAEAYCEWLVSWRTVPTSADQALHAYQREVERLRAIEAAAREVYKCLKLAGAQYTPQGTRLAEALKIKHDPQAPEDNDFA